ncbi:MAG: alpha-L-arabinofuranosidase C-terminal domain-containing protein [Planctomycetota bacterium]
MDFSDTEYYNLFPRALQIETDIVEAATALALYNRTDRHVGVILDEWGVWHPEARGDSGLYQRNTLRDALAAAAVFDVLNRHAATVTMANIAQTINVLQCLAQTDGEAMWLTPTCHAFALYKPHLGNASVRLDLDDVPTVTARGADGREVALPVVSASASMDAGRKRAVVTFQNLHLDEPCSVRLRLRGGSVAKATAKVLTAGDVREVNGPAAPRRVRPRRFELEARKRSLRAEVPPHALVSVTVRLS